MCDFIGKCDNRVRIANKHGECNRENNFPDCLCVTERTDPMPSSVRVGSMPELDMTDDQIMEWAKATYSDKLPDKLLEMRNMIDRAIVKSRKSRKA